MSENLPLLNLEELEWLESICLTPRSIEDIPVAIAKIVPSKILSKFEDFEYIAPLGGGMVCVTQAGLEAIERTLQAIPCFFICAGCAIELFYYPYRGWSKENVLPSDPDYCTEPFGKEKAKVVHPTDSHYPVPVYRS